VSGTTGIAWTGATANLFSWRCKHRSPGCDNCYAEALTNWVQGPGAFTSGPPQLRPSRLLLPLIDKKYVAKDKVFYASMSEPFDPRIPLDELALAWAVLAVDRRHVWQVLSKLHGPMHARLTSTKFQDMVRDATAEIMTRLAAPRRLSKERRAALAVAEAAVDDFRWPLPNVWLGSSTENQTYADLRLGKLLATPAVIHFISAEPLLSHIRLDRYLPRPVADNTPGGGEPGFSYSVPGLDWVIAGGESGPYRREMDPAWLGALHDQCREAGVAFFAKQDSDLKPGQRGRIPDEHWVHEFPPYTLAAA
jgi:protein gp37